MFALVLLIVPWTANMTRDVELVLVSAITRGVSGREGISKERRLVIGRGGGRDRGNTHGLESQPTQKRARVQYKLKSEAEL